MPYPETIGSIAGYSVQIGQRNAKSSDPVYNPNNPGMTYTAALVKGASATEIFAGDVGGAVVAARAALSAFAAIGAQVALGNPQAPITAGGSGPISRAAVLTPGTPLPPCRAVTVSPGGKATLVLAGGGTYPAGADSALETGRLINVSAVDATDVSAGTIVSFYY